MDIKHGPGNDKPNFHLSGWIPLRKRLGDILSAKPLTCLPMDFASDVAKKMQDNKRSAVIVTAFSGKAIGIVTEKDFVDKIASAGDFNQNRRAHEIMSSPLISLRPEDFSYRALMLMLNFRIGHVAVTDSHDVLLGVIALKDFFSGDSSNVLTLVDKINALDSLSDLVWTGLEIDTILQAMLDERAFGSEICALVTELYDLVIGKIIILAENELKAKGLNAPPGGYCFINMGSAGRMEQFTRTDQDNGIIYADPGPGETETAAEYYHNLGRIIVKALEESGFSRCPGDVMAENRAWCKPLSLWKTDVDRWSQTLDPQSVRDLTIFLDFRCVSGKRELYDELKLYTLNIFKNSEHALQFLAEDDLNHRVPINLFRRVISSGLHPQRRRLNLKNSAMVHMVDCIRVFALREGINETNTFARLSRLKELKVFRRAEADFLAAAYENLMLMRIKNAARQINLGSERDNYIDIKDLDKNDQILLKESLNIANRLQTLVMHTFHVHKA